jgi:hypothetical protein
MSGVWCQFLGERRPHVSQDTSRLPVPSTSSDGARRCGSLPSTTLARPGSTRGSMWACTELASGYRRRLSYAAYIHTGGFDFDLGAAAMIGFLTVST